MRTRRYCYRLKGLDQVIGFRLEVNSKAHILFNDLLIRNKRKKKTITVSIEDVIKLAKEGMNKQRIQNTTFINMIKHEVGESGQKIFNRIFQLALERYAQLQGEGQRPILIPHTIPQEVKAIPRPAPAPAPRPTPEKQPIERSITSDLHLLQTLIPQHLHKHLKFECDHENKKIIVTQTTYIEMKEWGKIADVSKRYNGTYKNSIFTFPFPLKERTTTFG